MSRVDQRTTARPPRRKVVAPPQPTRKRWFRSSWTYLLLAFAALCIGLILLNRFPWGWFNEPRETGLKRVVGTVEAVSMGNDSICIKPSGKQICGAVQMAQVIPSKGQRVVAYYTFVPTDASGDPRNLVWVAIFSDD